MKVIIALAALAATPALAQGQPAPPMPPQPPQIYTHDQRSAPNMQPARPNERIHIRRSMRLAAISPEGRDILRGAVSPDRAVERAAVREARDRVNAIIGAERLDVSALRRAMDEEAKLVEGMRDRRRAALLEAVQKLSVADRQAFAANAQRGRERLGRQVRFIRYRDGAVAPRPPMPPMPPEPR